MPFNSATGVYTPPNGAENAFPGEVIASATWNAVFTDIAAALTQLGQSQIIITPRTISSSGNFTVSVGDRIILVQVSTPSIFLPSGSVKLCPVTIIGDSGSVFGSNNAVLVPSGSEKIDNLSSVTLTGNYQAITLLPLTGGGYLVMG